MHIFLCTLHIKNVHRGASCSLAGVRNQMPENVLYYGDNLEVLRLHVNEESVDLIYLDPPFKSNREKSMSKNTWPRGKYSGPGSGF